MRRSIIAETISELIPGKCTLLRRHSENFESLKQLSIVTGGNVLGGHIPHLQRNEQVGLNGQDNLYIRLNTLLADQPSFGRQPLLCAE